MDNKRFSFSKEHFDVLARISRRFFGEIPCFKEIWNPAIESSLKSGRSDCGCSNLVRYIRSFRTACEQALYSIECLKGFSTHEPSNITEFYVAYFVNDFIIRIKTGTDILALMLKAVYGLDIDDKECSLENGRVVSSLRSTRLQTARKVAREIDRVRNKWLRSFDKVRDLVVHRAGLSFIMAATTDYPVHIELTLPDIAKNQPIHYDPGNPLEALKPCSDHEPLLKFLTQIGSKSASEYLITIHPILFCEEIWRLMSSSTERILGLCKEDLFAQLQKL